MSVGDNNIDRALLEQAINRDDLREGVRGAFLDMAENVVGRGRALSQKQRAWVASVVDGTEYDDYEHRPLSDFPRGKEVPLPPVLMHLPKRPPGMR